jgi:hypothetical protein
MAYGEALPTDSASKKFEGVLAANGAANEMVAKAGVNRRAQNAEIVADQVVDVTTTSGLGQEMDTRLPASLGQKAMAGSLPVVLPSDQTLPVSIASLDASGVAWPEAMRYLTAPSAVADQHLTVSSAVVQFTALSYGGMAIMTVEDASVRVTFDGSNPTASVGHLLVPGMVMLWSATLVNVAKFIRVTIDAKINLSALIFGRTDITEDHLEALVNDTNIYASGDCIGGKLSHLINIFEGGSLTLVNVILTDNEKTNTPVDLVFFYANPASTTFTDNVPLDVDDDDLGLIAGVIHLLTADYIDFADNSVVHWTGEIPMQLTLGTLYFTVVCRGTPTFIAADSLKIHFVWRHEVG